MSRAPTVPTADHGERLPRGARIRKRRLFLRVQSRGVKVHGKYVVVFAARGPDLGARLGITASKKVGNAVARNRAKRLIRESFRRQRGELPGWLDAVVVARHAIQGQPLSGVRRDLGRCLERAVELIVRRAGGPRRQRHG